MLEEKAGFVRLQLVPLLHQIPSDTTPRWGKMTLQQMIEHFADSVKIASGKTLITDIITPEEHLQKYRGFLMSEKPFKENTVNPTLSEVPAPVRNPTLEEALLELKSEIDYFFSVFSEDNPGVTRHPVFGDLNYEQNVQLLHKHALHHLRQFGIELN